MSENSETNTSTLQVQEIEEVISGLEQYRERIINDTLEMAKKLKVPKKQAMENLAQHPEIARIDAMLDNLRNQLASFSS